MRRRVPGIDGRRPLGVDVLERSDCCRMMAEWFGRWGGEPTDAALAVFCGIGGVDIHSGPVEREAGPLSHFARPLVHAEKDVDHLWHFGARDHDAVAADDKVIVDGKAGSLFPEWPKFDWQVRLLVRESFHDGFSKGHECRVCRRCRFDFVERRVGHFLLGTGPFRDHVYDCFPSCVRGWPLS